ncbi:MAG: bifunctional glutamate N-acetyltransferase/amino-acid acetyltransferase ArgJ [Clostridiales bacterium]|nr:bifunctional glutamate N-acetyltransferase/amino-acid acetyltransferase ArgJ [Clostridiales bacterium]
MSGNVLENGSVTSPAGFLAGSAMAGIKSLDRYDLTIVYSPTPASIAGVFTTNKVKAAPVLLSQANLAACGGKGHAIVLNSGCANACTGAQGMEDAAQTVQAVANALGFADTEALVASTGVIGAYLPMEKILAGVREAAGCMDAGGGTRAARAIMTTDTVAKEIAISVDVGGYSVTIGAMAKGSGMIHPDMATLLSVVSTDCAIAPAALQEALREACEATFNMVTVDGDTSTNDCLVALANGMAGNPVIQQATDLGYSAFVEGLIQVCSHMAQMIAKDGEGASKFIEVTVEGAKTCKDARLAARAVTGSSLVKAAVYGKDANWGRILCAMGYSGADFDPSMVDLYMGSIQMMDQGKALLFDEEKALAYLENDEIRILAKLHQGQERAVAWGCDLTHEYVTINGSYRT